MNNKLLIVKVKKNSNGDVTDVMLNDGSIYSIDEAISMSKDGSIEDIIIKKGKDGIEYYRNNPTGLGNLNFNNIPEF